MSEDGPFGTLGRNPLLIKVRKADSLPSLYSYGDDQKDAGGEGEVTAALEEGEDKVN